MFRSRGCPRPLRSREHPGHLHTVPADDITAIATLVLAAGAAALAVVTCAVARDGRRRDDRKRAADRDRGDRQDSHPALCAQAHAAGPPVQPSRRAGPGNAAAARGAGPPVREQFTAGLMANRSHHPAEATPLPAAGSLRPGGAGQPTPGSRVLRGPRRRTRERGPGRADPEIPLLNPRRQLTAGNSRRCRIRAFNF